MATDGTDLFVAGEFASYRGVGCPRVIKLASTDGVMMAGFNWGTGASGGSGFYVFFDQVTDELFIKTSGQNYNGVPTRPLIKVDKNTGVINPAFGSLLISADSTIKKVLFLPNNQLMPFYSGAGSIGGRFKCMVKYNLQTWSLDPVFDGGTGFNGFVNSVIVVGNYIYVGGTFTSYNGQPAQRLAKIHKDTGVLDAGFTQAVGFSGGALVQLSIA